MAKDRLSTARPKKNSDASDAPKKSRFVGRNLIDPNNSEGKKWIGSRDESGLTPRQAAFVREFTSGETAGNASKSVIAAGYDTKQPGVVACALSKLPHVTAAIDAALREAIGATLTAKAVQVIRAVLEDKNAPLKIRCDMAAKVVEFSGIVGRVAHEKARETGLDGVRDGPKRLGEMTRGELENLVQNGAMILQAAAALPPQKPAIEGAPSDTVQVFPSNPPNGHASLMASKG